jgi:hypothetical protein
VSSTKRKKWRLRGVKPLITLKTHVPAGKRKDGGCIALRVPNEVLSLKTQAAVAKDSHHAMNRSGKRKKSQAGDSDNGADTVMMAPPVMTVSETMAVTAVAAMMMATTSTRFLQSSAVDSQAPTGGSVSVDVSSR